MDECGVEREQTVALTAEWCLEEECSDVAEIMRVVGALWGKEESTEVHLWDEKECKSAKGEDGFAVVYNCTKCFAGGCQKCGCSIDGRRRARRRCILGGDTAQVK